MNRRELLQLGLVGAAGLTAAACSPLARKVAGRALPDDLQAPPNSERLVRNLNRAGFGPAPGDLAQIQQQGWEAWVTEQLHPTDDDELALKLQLAHMDVNRLGSAELREVPEQRVMAELRASAILRAVYSKWQIRERMVDFWTNHFNIFALKGDGAYRKGVDDCKVIRTHALGSFQEMVKASARSAAMLGYLDNVSNRKGVPNENYARELMELHTLGVHGGYTQDDVREVARCFTGWTIENRFLRPRDQFRFDPLQHDDGPKVVLGHHIPAGQGAADGERVIEVLTHHPSCASFLAGKLCRHFLGSASESITKSVAAEYLRTKGDIRSILAVLFAKPEFHAGGSILKRPYDFLVSALRATGAVTDGGEAVQGQLSNMGQPLFGWPMPDGYPDRTESWTGSLLARWNFASDLAHARIPGTTLPDPKVLHHAESLVFGRNRPSDSHLDPRDHLALCVASPEFQWR